MATSGSWDYNLTAATVITEAIESLGVLSPGGTIVSAHQTAMLRKLNLIVKQWQGTPDFAPGLKVHTRQRINLFLAKGQQRYLVGPASGDARSAVTYGRTTISANEASGQTTLSITSNTDTTTFPGTTVTMTASDIVGIEQNDGTIHWTTISGTPASTMDIAAQLTAAANAGNYVWWFTSRAQRFVAIESAVLRDENYKDTPLDIYRTVEDYELGVTDKYADGDPSAILVEPLRITTAVTLDVQPSDVTKTIVLTALYPQEDYDATTNDVALPQEWLRPLAWQLAMDSAPMFGLPVTPLMKMNRDEALAIARSLNPEMSNAYFQPGCPG